MKHVKNRNNFTNEKLDIDSRFDFLKGIEIWDRKKSKISAIEFLESLDLTEEQYVDLASIMEDYGYNRYSDGENSHYELYG